MEKQNIQTKARDASAVNAMVIQLEHGKTYKNRKGGKVTVYNDDMLNDYPYKDDLGTRYTKNGKVWNGKESSYDLVEAV